MPRLERGFVYLWALFTVVLAGIVMAGTGQMWQTKSQREKEAELMFIGEEFRKAIMSYHNSGTKQYPDSLEDLLKDNRSPNIKRHLRKIYVDPLTNTAEWGIVEEPPPNTSPASSTTKPAANKSATPSTANPTASNSVAGNNSATPNSNQTATTNQTQASNTGATSGNTTTPSSSSSMSANISKKIIGVYSLSEKKPIKKSQFPEHFAKFSEALTYKDWQFVYKPGDAKSPSTPSATSTKPGAASGTNPFASQSSSTSSSTTPSKGASPFGSPSDSSKAPATGFSSGQ